MRLGRKRWLYWGEEDEIEDSKGPFEWFWFIEPDPPYRRGRGIRFRERHDTAWHIGVALAAPVSSTEEALGGRRIEDVSVTEIAEWQAPLRDGEF